MAAHALKNNDDYAALRRAARQSVIHRYDLKTVCLPGQLNLIASLHGQRTIKDKTP
jgi:hypothetical protein